MTDTFISRYHDYLGRTGESALGVRETRSGSSHDRRLTNLPLQIKQMTTLSSTASSNTNVFASQALSGTHSHKTLHPKSLSSALQSTAVTSSKANQPYQSIQLKNTASTGSLFGGKGSHENFNSTNNLMSTLDEAQSNVNILLKGAPP